jgi:hypothetical protein
MNQKSGCYVPSGGDCAFPWPVSSAFCSSSAAPGHHGGAVWQAAEDQVADLAPKAFDRSMN